MNDIADKFVHSMLLMVFFVPRVLIKVFLVVAILAVKLLICIAWGLVFIVAFLLQIFILTPSQKEEVTKIIGGENEN